MNTGSCRWSQRDRFPRSRPPQCHPDTCRNCKQTGHSSRDEPVCNPPHPVPGVPRTCPTWPCRSGTAGAQSGSLLQTAWLP
ncbi:MAG TPA: hypothetical protein DEG76_06265 [Pseudohongiella sp.]|nr:hypothetical protein [Pseudohongiella sp.]HBX36897.1 hypothetical protein [Pseudohongiella sp.]